MIKRNVVTAFWHGGHPYLLGRVMKADESTNDEEAIVAADVSAIAYEIFNKDTLASLETGTLSPVSDYVLAALSTGDIWTVDATGFNFKWVAAGDLFTASVTHRVKVTLSLTNDEDVVLVFELRAANPAGD